MNFFGHAVVASRICSEPEFVLGSMVPDFEGMIAQSATRFLSPQLRAGIRAHHATDHVFHSSDAFLRHQAQARSELQAAQLTSGPRRAVAHVGVELLLDAALGAAADRTESYKTALKAGLQPTALAGASLLTRAKLSTLLTSLRARAAYVVPKTPQDVVARLERIFASRPSLSLRPRDLPAIADWAQRAWEPISSEAEDWLAQLVDLTSRRLSTMVDQSPPGTSPVPGKPNRSATSQSCELL